MRLARIPFAATAAVIGAVVLAACGGSSNATHTTTGGRVTVTDTVTETIPATSTTPPGTTSPPTTTTGTAHSTACTASDLTPSYLGSNGAAGTFVLAIALKNTGSASCHTYGWPGVQFLSASGAKLPTHARRTTSDVVGATPANVLTLKPGEEASFRIAASDVGPGGTSCPNATRLQIYAPDDTVTMHVALPGIAACGRATLSPMLPGKSAFSGQ